MRGPLEYGTKGGDDGVRHGTGGRERPGHITLIEFADTLHIPKTEERRIYDISTFYTCMAVKSLSLL